MHSTDVSAETSRYKKTEIPLNAYRNKQQTRTFIADNSRWQGLVRGLKSGRLMCHLLEQLCWNLFLAGATVAASGGTAALWNLFPKRLS